MAKGVGDHMTIAARVVVVQSLLGPVAERKLRGRGIRALCPMYSREVRHARRTEIKSYPLYSRYMFAWVDDDQLREVLSVAECIDVLRKAGSPRELSIVPDHVIEMISGVSTPLHFERGERVEISHGKWEGMQALFHEREDQRVTLLFQMLGRECPMQFHISEIRKIQPHGQGRRL